MTDLTQYLHCAELLSHNGPLRSLPKFYLSLPTHCECGALVRLLGEPKVGGAWICPLCGAKYPYCFWKVSSEKGGPVIPLKGDLILALGPEPCVECGESNPPCRCDRRAAEGAA